MGSKGKQIFDDQIKQETTSSEEFENNFDDNLDEGGCEEEVNVSSVVAGPHIKCEIEDTQITCVQNTYSEAIGCNGSSSCQNDESAMKISRHFVKDLRQVAKEKKNVEKTEREISYPHTTGKTNDDIRITQSEKFFICKHRKTNYDFNLKFLEHLAKQNLDNYNDEIMVEQTSNIKKITETKLSDCQNQEKIKDNLEILQLKNFCKRCGNKYYSNLEFLEPQAKQKLDECHVKILINRTSKVKDRKKICDDCKLEVIEISDEEETPLLTRLVKEAKVCNCQSQEKTRNDLRMPQSEKLVICEQCENNYDYNSEFLEQLAKHNLDNCNYEIMIDQVVVDKHKKQIDDNHKRKVNKITDENEIPLIITLANEAKVCKNCRDQKEFKCSLCKFSSGLIGKLNYHVKTVHTVNRPFKCKLCGSAFKRISALNQHMTSHSKKRRHTCACGASYRYRSGLNLHIKNNTVRCPKCNTTSITCKGSGCDCRAKMIKVSIFTCNKCSFTTNHKGAYKRHINVVHMGQKPFKCKRCDKVYSTQTGFRLHMDNVHLRKEPENCKTRVKPSTQKMTTRSKSLNTENLIANSNVL